MGVMKGGGGWYGGCNEGGGVTVAVMRGGWYCGCNEGGWYCGCVMGGVLVFKNGSWCLNVMDNTQHTQHKKHNTKNTTKKNTHTLTLGVGGGFQLVEHLLH